VYTRKTSISGLDDSGEHKFQLRAGHWSLPAAIRAGRRVGIVGRMRIAHNVYDLSGHGRGGHDGEWTVAADDSVSRASMWREGNRERN